jgi:hypothetical protein
VVTADHMRLDLANAHLPPRSVADLSLSPYRANQRTNLWHIPSRTSPRRTLATEVAGAMASYKEMLALGRDPVRVRALARRLLASEEDWTEWERDLLEELVAEYGSDALTTRQREKLVELRNGAEYVFKIEELDVASLIDKCWVRRLDLDYEDDIAFIEQERGSSSIKRRHVERLLRCCRKLGVIET